MIEIISLSKSLGTTPVLRGVNLSVSPGEFVTILGPNGAGKTTLLRIVATLLRSNAGQVNVCRLSLSTQSYEVRQLLGFVSHDPLLYGELTAEENLLFFARMYGWQEAQERIDSVLSLVGLTPRRDDLVRTFSRGMQQRLAIARATLHQPEVLLFDEPHTGLDQDAATMLDGVLRKLAADGQTILMTTHDFTRGLELSDRVAILNGGQIAYEARSSTVDPTAFSDKYHQIIHAQTC